MDAHPLRRRIEIAVPLAPADLRAQLDARLRAAPTLDGRVRRQAVLVWLAKPARRWWSPCLDLAVEPDGQGTRLEGYACAHPHLMTGLMFALFVGLAFGAPGETEALYVEHCASCHGKGGRATFPGVMMSAGSFANPGFWEGRPPERWRETVASGGPSQGLKKTMPAFGDVLTAAQIDALVAYARGFLDAAPDAAPPAVR